MAEKQTYSYEDDPALSAPAGSPAAQAAAAASPDSSSDSSSSAPLSYSYADDPNLSKPVEGQAPDRGLLGNVNQRAGSFASGVNRAGIAAALGAPVDLATGAINYGVIAPLNYMFPPDRNLSQQVTGQEPPPRFAPITRPQGGSERIGDFLASTVGETKPEDLTDKVLYGAGGALGQTAIGMGAGTGLQALSRAPRTAEALIGGPQLTTPTAASNLSIGAASGAGSALGEAGADAATGGDSPTARAVGGIAGGLAAGVPVGLVPAAWQAGRNLLRPFTDAGRDVLAGRDLLKASGGQIPSLSPDTPLGLDYSLGQRTNNPGLLKFERALENNATPEIAGQFEADRSFNNQEVRKAMGQVGTAGDAADQSQTLAGALDAAHQQARQDVTDAYRAIPGATVPTQPLKDAFTDFVGTLTKVRRDFVPENYERILMSLDDNEPMREVMDLRSSLLADERRARSGPQPDYNKANVLRDLDNALFQRIPEGGVPGVTTPDQVATLAYQRANQLNTDFNATFNAGPMRKIFQGKGYDASVPDSAVAQKLLGAGQGQTERVAQFVKAAGLDPDAMQNARDWFSTQLSNKVAGARQDAAGDPEILGNVMRKFVGDNAPLINSPIFTQRQRDLINEIVGAVQMGERTARAGSRGGSDTAANLAGGRYLDKVVGGWFGPMVEGAISGVGALAGGAIAGTPGAIVGMRAGEAAGKGLTQNPRVAAQMQDLLYRATRNPDVAIQLMQKATKANDAFMGPGLRQILLRSAVPGAVGQRLPSGQQSPQGRAAGR